MPIAARLNAPRVVQLPDTRFSRWTSRDAPLLLLQPYVNAFANTCGYWELDRREVEETALGILSASTPRPPRQLACSATRQGLTA